MLAHSNHNHQLTAQEKQNPSTVFDQFFDHYQLESAQKQLNELVQVGLITDNQAYDSGKKRDYLISFYHQMLKVMEAAHLMKAS